MPIRQHTLVAAVILLLTVGFVAGLVISGRMSLTPTSAAATTEQAAPARPAVSLPMASALPDLSAVAEAALKSAANISATTVVQVRNPFPFFFDNGNQLQESQSLGSGVIMSPDGYVLTNAHVIVNAGATVKVTLSDGRERPGRLIGIDDVSDLAVVKIDGTNLATLPWGDSSKLRVAEWVLAIGNPFQLSGTVTLGIVSTVLRSAEQVGSEYSSFIQTDAAINPGNSGGALINARGELIGINSAINSTTGGNQGIGFAIPSNEVRDVMTELVKNGAMHWGSLGTGWVSYPLDRATAQANGFGDIEGVLVRRISPQSSIYQGGARAGDVIVSFNGQKLTTIDQLNREVVKTPAGSTAKLGVIRDGHNVSLDVPIVGRQQQQTPTRRGQ